MDDETRNAPWQRWRRRLAPTDAQDGAASARWHRVRIALAALAAVLAWFLIIVVASVEEPQPTPTGRASPR